MIGGKPKGLAQNAVLLYPALMLGVFFVVPFGTMLAMSFFRKSDQLYEPAFELTNYAQFLTAFFGKTLGFSLLLAGIAALISVTVAFPFTYLMTRQPRRVQVRWLVFILAVLSLSEVIIGFAWATLLSRTAGLSNVLVWLGLLETPQAWSPGFPALLLGLCYVGFPYTVLVLYPALSRLDPELPEASRMLGRLAAAQLLRRRGARPSELDHQFADHGVRLQPRRLRAAAGSGTAAALDAVRA